MTMTLTRQLPRSLNSISFKIVLPYLILTLIVAVVSAYIVTNLVTGSLQERVDNQLVDAGHLVSEGMVEYEKERLRLLRSIAFTDGLPELVAAGDEEAVAALIQPVAANSGLEMAAVIDEQGVELFGWQRVPDQSEPVITTAGNYAALPDVEKVLAGVQDELGDKQVFLANGPSGLLLITVGPIYDDNGIVGAALVGSRLDSLVRSLSETAVARVTLYTPEGKVLETTLGLNSEDQLRENPERYTDVLLQLQEAPEQYQVVTNAAGESVPLRIEEILGQPYQLAYGDWRVRDRSFGLYSVALPSNFIVSSAVVSRNWLALFFAVATAAVMLTGFVIARWIIRPINQLVNVSTAVAHGQLDQRTNIERPDEIGELARSFDIMTSNLVRRNREFAEQASNLEAILNSIADGVLVIDNESQILHSNVAAQQVLRDTLNEFEHQLTTGDSDQDLVLRQLIMSETSDKVQRYEVGEHVYSTLAAEVVGPEAEPLGRVVVLRDITRESEAERVKDSFITSISHELRTPLTSIKGYINLLLMTSRESLDSQQISLIDTANRNADRLIDHVNQMIEISEIQAGNLHLDLTPVHFARLVTETTARWREQFRAHDLSLDFRLYDRQLWVQGDQRKLIWAIENYLQNALDYTAAGGKVGVFIYQNSNEAVFEVIDNGIGIRESDQPYLFTRFFRIDNEPPFDKRGMGLGLFIVKSVIEAQGGRVWAHSRLGEGSRFGFALPLDLEQLVG